MMSHFTSDLFPKILICIPTLNKEEIIGPVLNNILSQSYPTEKMRILIVDGGSNDNTLGIVREILSNSNVNYKIIQRRSNIPEARNIMYRIDER
jgi:glycosyltransferase involved in cell wall biosynthesis